MSKNPNIPAAAKPAGVPINRRRFIASTSTLVGAGLLAHPLLSTSRAAAPAAKPVKKTPAREITSDYRALWDAPEVSARIADGIERYRKTNILVRVTDAAGKPVSGARVESAQTASDFHFGANIFMLDGYADPKLNARYADAFSGLFNAASIPFYWRDLEPVRGRPRYAANSAPVSRRPPPDAAIAFCRERNLRMHGHPLVWAYYKYSAPEWLSRNAADAADNARHWEKHVREIAARYSGVITRWDALNEPLYDARRMAAGTSCAIADGFHRDSFHWAADAFPVGTRLYHNEVTGSWRPDTGRGLPSIESNTALIRSFLNSGTPVSGLGLQFHHFKDSGIRRIAAGDIDRPADFLAALDRYAAFGLPVHISEITLTAPEAAPWGEAMQAAVARNYYRLWFSHPCVEGITWWNVPDGGAAPDENKVYSGLLRGDLAPKPSYEALHGLIHDEWRTRHTGKTDADGRHHYRAFTGTHRVAITLPNGAKLTRDLVTTTQASGVSELAVKI